VLWSGLCMCLAVSAVQAQTRILPLGDSVTSSFAPYSSYRYWLWLSLTNAGLDVDFVGSQHGVADGTPDKTGYDWDHEGHPGWTTADGVAHIDSIANSSQPDIVLLDLGSNDVSSEWDPTISSNNLAVIIEHLRNVNPNVVVLMAFPTPFLGEDRHLMSQLRTSIQKVAKMENLPESPVVCVNIAGGFSAKADTFDGMHPNEKGEKKIAKRFYKVLRKFLAS